MSILLDALKKQNPAFAAAVAKAQAKVAKAQAEVARQQKQALNAINKAKKSVTLDNQTMNIVDVLVNKNNAFTMTFADLTSNYRIMKVKTDEKVDRWRTDPMSFYQNQLNFAVYCATTACGVGLDLLNADDKYVYAIFNFHLYFTIRKILNELQAPIPGDTIFDALDNQYDKSLFRDICLEFGIPENKSFKQTRDNYTNGLGTAYYWPDNKFVPVPGNNYDTSKLHLEYSYYRRNMMDGTKMGFGLDDPPGGSGRYSDITVGFIRQSEQVQTAWLDFIPRTSNITSIGIQKVNESIIAYVYSLLSAQALTRTSVLTPSVGIMAKRKFHDLVEDIIYARNNVETSIAEYQDALQNAMTPLNYVIKPGLYLIPSDMNLRIGTHDGYNNNLLTANDDMQTGVVPDLNAEPVMEDSFADDIPQEADSPDQELPVKPIIEPELPVKPASHQAQTPKPKLEDHQEDKMALTIGTLSILAIGIIVYEFVFK